MQIYLLFLSLWLRGAIRQNVGFLFFNHLLYVCLETLVELIVGEFRCFVFGRKGRDIFGGARIFLLILPRLKSTFHMPAPVPYYDFSSFLARYFRGKVQKLSVDAGFTCPNRDGRVGRGGCTYCNNRSFRPDYCRELPTVTEQLEAGKRFFSRKYPHMQYLAYFQAYTSTYAELPRLRALYEEALAVPGVVGLVVSTRPDCVSNDLLDYMSDLSRRMFVLMEYGVESVEDTTLHRICRGHDFACAAEAVRRTAERGVKVGAHVILGLPGEGRETILRQAAVLSELPLDVLKMHQLQIVRGTFMAREYEERPDDFHLFTPEEYAELVVDYLERLRPGIAVDRFTSQSPSGLLIAPDWGWKNHRFAELVKRRLCERRTWQGRRWASPMEVPHTGEDE